MKKSFSNLHILLIGKFMSLFASNLFTFIAGLTVLTTSGSGLQFAIVLLAGTLPRILLSPFAGAYADKLNRKRVIVNMETLNGLLFLLAGISSLIWTFNVPAYLLITALLSVFSTFLSVTLSSSIPLLFKEEELQRTNSLIQSIISFSSIGTPLLAGALFKILPISVFLFSSAVFFFIAGLVATQLKFQTHDIQETSQSTWKEVQSGFQYLKKQRVLWTIALLATFLNFFFVASEVLFPIAALQEIGVSPLQFGFLESMFAIGFLVASLLHALPFFKIKYRLSTMRSALIVLSLLFIGPAIPLYFTFNVLPAILFFSFFALLSGLFVIRANIPIQMYLQTNTDPNYLGRVMGVLESLAMGITPLGFILFGFLSDLIPVALLYTICMVCLLSLTLISMHRIRHDIQAERATVQSIERIS
ncbi:MFS transporter [Exiguobacterium sp. B2(2022)]|uniref:MFS transporter n=1 Tax=Exiguobacterium sp. B2(2022) TaxID=2992755 RepID=UPI00237BAED7|nr:MFS transporter [Exiguobacterium sp. B2(2022)]MDE0564532.1 MFS transporter [Exiguobacterium sp. B2(2022)]